MGSPRIDVTLQAQRQSTVSLEQLVAENLRDMARLEEEKQIKIASIDQQNSKIGQRRAIRVRHEYTVGNDTNQIAISQLAVMFVLNGRGIVITAYGRTELFHPLAASIEKLLGGVFIMSQTKPVLEHQAKTLRNKPGESDSKGEGSRLKTVK
jgi:hypothetical protein